MGRRKKPFLENITITDIGAEGKAIAKHSGKVIFIPFGIPGDIIDIQITSSKKNFNEGYIVNFRKHSNLRIRPFCQHFGTCGGCKWQHLPYEKQLHFKQKQVIDNFERIGKLDGFQTNEILPSEDTIHYRNKLEFTFSNKRWLTNEELKLDKIIDDRTALGFHLPKKFDKVLDIKECFLQPSPSNDIRLAVTHFARENNYSFFNIIEQEGFLRNLIIRTSLSSETMVIFSFFYEDKEKSEKLLNYIKDKFPEIVSLMYVINQKQNENLNDQEIKLFHGKDHIYEEMDGLKFKIGPKSFYQINSKQAKRLYDIILKMADLKKDYIVYDLYSGTGTIAMYLARYCKMSIGIEIIPEAIIDAQENAVKNNIKNVKFHTGDIKEIINDHFLNKYNTPDVIILDPPRSGLHPMVITLIKKIKAPRIIYVSCNPATQARDLLLLKNMYTVDEIQPIDMFPHTYHVENVAKITLK